MFQKDDDRGRRWKEGARQQAAINFNYCGCYHSIAVVGNDNMLRCPSSTLLDLFYLEKDCSLACLLTHPPSKKKKFAIRFLGVNGMVVVANREACGNWCPSVVGRSRPVVLLRCSSFLFFLLWNNNNNINFWQIPRHHVVFVKWLGSWSDAARPPHKIFIDLSRTDTLGKFIHIGIIVGK